MAKKPQPPSEPAKLHTWSIYKIGKKQSFVGYVDAPDEQSAIAAAADVYQVHPTLRTKLLARRGR